MMSASATSGTLTESPTNLRYQCLQLMVQMQRKGGSLSRLLPEAMLRVAPTEQAQLQAWTYGWCRWSHELGALIDPLLSKPMKAKDLDVYLLLQLGVFQLRHTPTQAHAAVDETVKVVKRLKKPWARGVINGVLRNYQRQTESLQSALNDNDSGLHSHPPWLLARLQRDWPEKWQQICAANNTQAPMCLRVNQRIGTAEQYQQRLSDVNVSSQTLDALPQALLLDAPVPVDKLPGFAQGDVSVQDAAAQIACHLLCQHVPQGGRLLDACAAPGGKSAHAAESGWFSHITALDSDDVRLESVAQTLSRLNLANLFTLTHADASALSQWWDNTAFDAVLLDAPCSGTGVIRRHPDIKLLRRESDIANLVGVQHRLLDALWQTVAAQGVLVYATCSVLKDENENQVEAFLSRTSDARLLDKPWQIFPGEESKDGFFYAAMRKSG